METRGANFKHVVVYRFDSGFVLPIPYGYETSCVADQKFIVVQLEGGSSIFAFGLRWDRLEGQTFDGAGIHFEIIRGAFHNDILQREWNVNRCIFVSLARSFLPDR